MPSQQPRSNLRVVTTLRRQALSPPPIWFMRQAGRYLPEYRALRAKAGSFLDLCYTPELAAEVTLQPIRRFAFDAAILFSDILVVPDALGQSVRFVEGEGPRLEPICNRAHLSRLDSNAVGEKFARVFEAAERVRRELPDGTALIGFCGAPWTVATYMAGGKGSPDQAAARSWAYRDPEAFQQLVDLLTTVSVAFLSGQVTAGADVLQIFDSWAGNLPDHEFHRWVIAPTRTMVTQLRKMHPTIPIIGFPRGAGAQSPTYVEETGVDGLGCDTTMPLPYMAEVLSDKVVLQGNLDPLLLVAGGRPLAQRVTQILEAMAGKPFIFNLGHGIVPETPPDHVAQVVQLVREGRWT